MSDNDGSSKRVRVFGRGAGLGLVVLSLYCLFDVWIHHVVYPHEGFQSSDMVHLLVFAIPVSIFAGYCLVIAYRLYKGMTKESLRSVCFIFSIVFFFMLATAVLSALSSDSPMSETSMWTLSMALCMIPAGLIYWLTNKYLTRWLGFDTSVDWGRREQALVRFFGVMTFLVYGLFTRLAEIMEETYDIDPSGWQLGVLLLLPIVAAYVFYRLALRIALRGRPEGQDNECSGLPPVRLGSGQVLRESNNSGCSGERG